jgi:transposase
MVTDQQVRRLFEMQNKVDHFYQAADAAGMSVKTARKYVKTGKLPSQSKQDHTWKTHEDAFEADWPWIKEYLKVNPGLEAKALFEHLQRQRPGKYKDKQLRTFQRRVRRWHALEGPAKEIYFPQVYYPGQWAESDFTNMNFAKVTINGIPFKHLLYHFVLCYSNWETASICFSESYESLATGLQNALWKLGGVPRYHRTDNLGCAVNPVGNSEVFTDNYRSLARHYGFSTRKTQPACPNENGDVEQRHFRLKKAVEHALIIRGSRDFNSRADYEKFLEKLFKQLNSGRKEFLAEELNALKRLPTKKLPAYTERYCKVNSFSTIHVLKKTYSLHSRLRGEKVKARVYSESIEIWYAQRIIEKLPRLKGENDHYINYRHVIDILVRKPGAFENYRYKDDMFPGPQFRIAYDLLRQNFGNKKGNRQYLRILELSAKESEILVRRTLHYLINQGKELSFDTINEIVKSGQKPPAPTQINIRQVDLTSYDGLLEHGKGLQ